MTNRGDVHYVVTEHGVAYLHGKSIRERVLALSGVAHPEFRKNLLDHVKRKRYVYGDEQVWRQLGGEYPADWEHEHDFDGTVIRIRPLKAIDERILQDFFIVTG